MGIMCECENPKCRCGIVEEPEDYNQMNMGKKVCKCSDEGTCIFCEDNDRRNDMGKLANKGFTRDDSQTATRLLDKQWSPMCVRKYYVANWPLYVGLITDCNINDLDEVVLNIIDEAENYGFLDGNLQSCRNFCGFLSDKLDEHYSNMKKGSVEGIAIAWYVDKFFVSSLAKDHMVHKSCRDEFYSIIKVLPHI
jgi:hypothetical protein